MPERGQVTRSRQTRISFVIVSGGSGHRTARIAEMSSTKGTKSCERKGVTTIAHAVQKEYVGTTPIAPSSLLPVEGWHSRQEADGTCVGLDCDHETGYSFDP